MKDESGREIFTRLWREYTSAVNRGDAEAYSNLFTTDAIRMPPSQEHLDYGRLEIMRSEAADYLIDKWTISPRVLDVLELSDNWIYGIAMVEVVLTPNNGDDKKFRTVTAAWLLQLTVSEGWRIARHIWHAR